MEFYSGDEGATIRYLLGDVKDGTIRITGSRQLFMDVKAPSDPRMKGELTAFYNSHAFVHASENDQGERAEMRSEVVSRITASKPQGGYVGSDVCRTCHTAEYTQWRSTPHATAFKTLIENRRQHNPTCVSCHVVGFRTTSGYTMQARQQQLENVGCENCHGPGEKHSRAPATANIVRIVPVEICGSCHTPEHSEFPQQIQKYRKRVIHQLVTAKGRDR